MRPFWNRNRLVEDLKCLYWVDARSVTRSGVNNILSDVFVGTERLSEAILFVQQSECAIAFGTERLSEAILLVQQSLCAPSVGTECLSEAILFVQQSLCALSVGTERLSEAILRVQQSVCARSSLSECRSAVVLYTCSSRWKLRRDQKWNHNSRSILNSRNCWSYSSPRC